MIVLIFLTLLYEEPVRVTLHDLPTTNKEIEADHEYEAIDNYYPQACDPEEQVPPPNLEPLQLQLQLLSSVNDCKFSDLVPMATTCINSDTSNKLSDFDSQTQGVRSTTPVTSMQKNEAYGLVLANTQTSSNNVEFVSEPIIFQTAMSDPHTTDSASKDKHSSTSYSGLKLHTAEHLILGASAENVYDRESEHQSCEQVCTDEKVQPCNTNSLLHQAHQQDPSVCSEASNKDGNNDSTSISGRDEKTKEHSHLIAENINRCNYKSDSESYEQVCTYEKVQPCNLLHLSTEEPHSEAPKMDDHDNTSSTSGGDDKTETSPAKSLNSYKRVWGYERIDHCDPSLEEFLGQKDDDNTVHSSKN